MRKPPYTPESLGALYVPPETEPWKPPPWPSDCPPAGSVIPDASYEEYDAWPAINATALKHGSELSPKHMRQSVQDGTDTAARKFGRAVHCRLLEPSFFLARFKVAKPCSAKLKAKGREGEVCGSTGKFMDDADNWYCGTHKPKDVHTVTPSDRISQAEAARIEEMVKAVYAHPSVALMRQHGGCEVSLVWDRDGLPCKARLDKLIVDADCPDTIIDLKKVAAYSIDRHSLESSIANYFYDAQAYWYTEAVKRVLGKDAHFIWLFVEDGPPYDVCPLRASPRWLETGRCRAESALQTYRFCLETGKWPGVASDIEDSEPPKYLMQRYGIR